MINIKRSTLKENNSIVNINWTAETTANQTVFISYKDEVIHVFISGVIAYRCKTYTKNDNQISTQLMINMLISTGKIKFVI